MDLETWEKAGRPQHAEVKGGTVYLDGQPSDFELLDGKVVQPVAAQPSRENPLGSGPSSLPKSG